MTIDEIRKLKWDYLSPYIWEEQLPMTTIGKFNKKFACKKDVEVFISNQISITARKLNVGYNEFMQLVRNENIAFYTFLDSIYESWDGLDHKDSDFKKLQKFFKLPTLPDARANPVKDVLLRFEKLTDFQKIEVLEELKLISVHVNKIDESETSNHII